MDVWPTVKILLILIASIGAILGGYRVDAELDIGWEVVWAGVLVFPLMIILGLLILKVLLRRKLEFDPPRWTSNPFDFSHPEYFFHFGGVILVISGLCGVAADFIGERGFEVLALAPAAMGSGVLIGIWILKMTFRVQKSSYKI